MKTLHEKAKVYFDVLKTVFIDVIGVEKSSQLQQLKVLELFAPNAFMAGYETHQHETRWRSVEEELPEDQRIVMVKTNKNSFATAYLHGKSSGFITYGDTAYLDFGKITHWKPID